MPDNALPAAFGPTRRSRVHRHHERAHYDRASVFAILDAAVLCHVGYVLDGMPYVTPTLFRRDGERLYWHGSSASRMLRNQAEGIPVCLTVAYVDGLVLARSAFRHSANYRAVMAFGTAAIVRDEAAKEAGFNAFVERLYPGHTAGMRGTTAAELKATTLMSMVIDEASAKIRAGGPLDLEADLGAACRAGTIPIVQRLGVAIPDPLLDPAIAPLLHLGHFAEGGVLPDTLLALRHDVR